MKTPQLIFSLIALCISTGAAYADSATDTQTLSLTVPLVALIDVDDINPSFAFTAPTEAGQGFEDMEAPSNNKPKIAISSNNSNAKLNVQSASNAPMAAYWLSRPHAQKAMIPVLLIH